MNSRERVLTAVDRAEPDRVPVDFSANADTLARLYAALNCPSHRALLDRLGVDIVDLRGVVDPVYCGPVPKERELAGGVVENYWGWRTRRVTTAMGVEDCFCEFVLKDCESVDELAAHRWPRPDWFDFAGFADRLGPWEGRALMASGPSIFQHPTFLRSIEQMLVDFAAAPEMADFLMDRFTDFYEAFFDRMFSAAPGRIDLMRIADDLGTQHGLLLSPAHFDRFFAPRLRRLIDMARSHGVKVMFHSCGAIVPFIERIIALGVDVLDPIQVAADGMDPAAIKARFGGRICLHGAIDTQHVLPRGTPEDVADTARRMIDVLGRGGGYILAPSHVLQTDVPTANVIALYDAAARG
ncbi:MAG: uroporphyrinogen decarboxylase family protein [Pirellulaceae bacterium]